MSCGRDSRDPDEIKMSALVIDAKSLRPPSSSRMTHADVASSGLVESVRACDREVEHKLCQVGPTLMVRGETLVGVGRICAQVLTQRGRDN